MITFPNLPSDSLYKSFFFGGIILMVSASYFLTNGAEKKITRDIFLDSLKETLHIEIQHHKDDVNNVEKKLNAFDAEVGKISSEFKFLNQRRPVSNVQKLLLKNKYKQVQNENNILGEKLLKINHSTIDSIGLNLNKSFRDSLNVDLRQKVSELTFSFFNKIYFLMLFFGGIFTALGGVFWYFFVQQYQDAILRLQYLELVDKLSPRNKVKNIPYTEPKILSRRFFKNNNR